MSVTILVALLFVVLPIVLVGVLHVYGHARSRSYEQQRLEDKAQARALSAWQAEEAQHKQTRDLAGYSSDKPSVR